MILLWFIILCLASVFIYYAYKGYVNNKKGLSTTYVGLIIVVLVVGVLLTIPLTRTGSFQRALSSFRSEYTGGITRELVVYSMTGVEIYRTQGKFDIEHSNNRLRWIDEQGRTQIIYLGDSASVIVNELDTD